MAKVKAWKVGEAGHPEFPDDFTIVQKAVLQVTDIKTNHNKYYALELHCIGEPAGPPPINGDHKFRLYTHYGRTDDLESKPDSGQKECRYFRTLAEAQGFYQSIYREKTGPAKGYKEVSLASSRIGSQKARGTSTGDVDAKTLAKAKEAEAAKAAEGKAKAAKPSLDLHPGVQDLVRYIYSEATTALTTTVAARITAQGIETPLGILTVGQIEKGEAILAEMYGLFQKKPAGLKHKLEQLTGDFYSAIPHRIGRTRDAVAAAVINTNEAFGQKQETLQLMKDMLQVNGEAGSVLYDAQVEQQYLSLKADVRWLDHDGKEFREIASYVVGSQVKSKNVKVQNVYTVRRPGEWEQFRAEIPNQRLLLHGSRIQNWVGLLSRGILLPKIVVNLGVQRTDAGWLGHGLYFGDAACTACFYTTPGKKKTRLMALARVALGKMAPYHKITYGLTVPPPGYDSCHGVRHTPTSPSQFEDDEYCVYDMRQHRQEYLVEFAA